MKKPNGYWQSKVNCRQVAKKCKSKSELFKRFPSAYFACLKNNWIDEFYPGEVKPVEELPNGIKYKTVRKMMLDYVEVNGPQTRDEMRKVMLTICGQNIDDKKWGVGYWNNVSFGTSVFLPARKDKRYLKPIRTFDCSEVKYDIAIAEV